MFYKCILTIFAAVCFVHSKKKVCKLFCYDSMDYPIFMAIENGDSCWCSDIYGNCDVQYGLCPGIVADRYGEDNDLQERPDEDCDVSCEEPEGLMCGTFHVSRVVSPHTPYTRT